MKKTLSLILSLVMVLSCAVTFLTYVSAEDVLEAPADIRVQDTEPSGNLQNIRFIAGVKALKGAKLGYKILAEYTYKNEYKSTEYAATTTSVFTSVTANGETVYPSSDSLYGENTEYNYLFTMKIEDIPTSIGDIYFRIWTYIVDENGNETWSDETDIQYVDGEFDSTLYVNNFNAFSGSIGTYVESTDGSNLDTDTLANGCFGSAYNPNDSTAIEVGGKDTGLVLVNRNNFTKTFTDTISFVDGSVKAQDSDAKLVDSGIKLDLNGDILEIVPEDKLTGMYKYSIEADMKFTKCGVAYLIFNRADGASLTIDDAARLRCRLGAPVGTDITGEGNATTAASKLAIRNDVGSTKGKVISTEVSTGASTAEWFHITVDVDNLTKTMSVYINGELIQTLDISSNCDTASSVYMWLQNSEVTLDNLRVYGDNSSTAGKAIYSENFDGQAVNTDTASTLSSLGWRTVYANQYGATGVTADHKEFANIVNQSEGDNAVTIDGGWTKYEILSADKVVDVDKYTIQMDISFDATNGKFMNFSIIFGGCVDGSEYTVTDANAYGIQLRSFPSATANTPTAANTAPQYLGGYKIYTGTTYNTSDTTRAKRFNTDLMLEDVNKIVLEVDNANNTVVMSIYADGSDTANFTLTFTDFDVESSGVHLQSQVAEATIDNIVVSAGTYADYKANN